MSTQCSRATSGRLVGFPSLVVVTLAALFSADLCLADACTNNAPPVANAGPDKQAAVGASVTLDGTGSSDPDGQLTSYWWNFGDGSFTGWQDNAVVQHAFATAGAYNVRLWARDDCQVFSASDMMVVTVTNTGGCAGNQAPTAVAGNDRTVAVNETVAFSAAGSSDSDGSISTYSWNFGDGQSGSGAVINHAYSIAGTYSATLTVVDDCSGSASDTVSVVVSTNGSGASCGNNQSPTANAGPDQQGTVGSAVTLSGAASTDPNNNIAEYWWNFGDSQFTGWQSYATVTHVYSTPGNYSARLWVRDACGSMSTSDTAVVSIVSGGSCANNTPPTANAGPNLAGAPGQPVAFNGLSSFDADGSIQSYAWNFGDAQTGSGSITAHTYASAGTYTVTLTATDNCNASQSDTLVVTIQAPNSCTNNTAPTANAGPDVSGAVGSPITLNGSASSDANGTVSSYWWSYGDGGYSGWQSSPIASRTYVAIGNYTAKLWVRDNCGAISANDTAVVSVTQGQGSCVGNEAPVAVASGATEGHVGELLTFSAAGSHDPDGQVLTYHWTFSDGQSANGATVSRSFLLAGTMIATLIVTDPCGAEVEASHGFEVGEPYECTLDSQCPDDGLFCNGPEVCDDFHCVHEGNPCSDPQICDEASDACVECIVNDDCNDNNAETNDSCVENECLHTLASATCCDDDDPCTLNIRNADGTCSFPHGNDGAACDDHDPCTRNDVCAAGSCAGTAVSASDCAMSVRAEIRVLKLVYVDPCSDEEIWKPVGLSASDPAESGLRLKLDGTASVGAAYYVWRRNGASFGMSPSQIRTFSDPGQVGITLTVYSSSWAQQHERVATIHVAEGMQLIDTIPGGTGATTGIAVVGDAAWAIGAAPGSVRTVALAVQGGPAALDDGNLPSSGAYELAVSASLVAVSTLGAGVYLFDATHPENLGTVNGYDIQLGNTCPVAYNLEFVGQRYLYVACGFYGIEIVDLLNPASPVLLGLYTAAGTAQDDLRAVGNTVYVATGSLSAGQGNPPRIKVLDASDPVHPVVVGQVDVQRRARSIAVSGSVLAVAENEYNLSYSTGTIAFFDLSDSPFDPQFMGRVGGTLDRYRSVVLLGNSAYANYLSGIRKIDITRLDDPYLVSEFGLGGYAPSLAIHGDTLVAGAAGSTGLSIISTGLQP